MDSETQPLVENVEGEEAGEDYGPMKGLRQAWEVEMGSESPPPLENGEEGEDYGGPVKGLREAWKLLLVEAPKVSRVAAPTALNLLLGYGATSSVQIFAGHVGTLQLSVVSTALSVVNLFASGFVIGMASALETLCGQAFGAGQVGMLGTYMQRSWIVLTITAFLVCPIYLFATPILELLGQDDQIAVSAGQFAVLVLPQLFALAFGSPSGKFLLVQSKVWILVKIAFMALLIHVGLLGLFIHVFDWGLAGVAAAMNISSWITPLGQLVYIRAWCKDGWTGLSWSAFRDIWAFVRLSLASALMLSLEIWCVPVLMVFTGHLDNAQIAVGSFSICFNINMWESLLLSGFNAAASVRVSNELGSGHPRAAKFSIIVVMSMSLVIGLLACGIILATQEYFAILFTSDTELQKAVANLAYILAVNMILNSIAIPISGLAVGVGWQTLVAYISLGTIIFVGLPLSYLFGYILQWGVQGIWGGMMCGGVIQVLVLVAKVYKTDWKNEAAHATERIRLWGGQDESQKLKT